MMTSADQNKIAATTVGMGQCPLVLGECVQGQTEDRRHFLITSPIGLFSWAEFFSGHEHDDLTVEPAGCWKALAAAKAYLSGQGLTQRGMLRITNPIGPGQGFGTSTADITAAVRAVSAACNRTVSPQAVAQIAIEIEPTDGSMYPGCVAFAQREGVLLEDLGSLPRFDALVVCTGGVVDTMEFDQRRKDFRYSRADQSNLLMAWEMVRQANQTDDAALLARAATISARINEHLLPKPYFKEVSRFSECEGADGVMVAHSGTALALIFDPSHFGHTDRIARAKQFLASLCAPAWFQISNRNMVQGISASRVGSAHTVWSTANPVEGGFVPCATS